ncbi:NAD(P)-dependent alcohol dehydrogenase [Streptomyces sp. TRM 70351]|uniref:NAD(P)-dependent alcohol dehydrogenase n=1 Tax=Streptomyces sp. TRM 70351 TaxID=3116552 RepID=UPI002E7B47E2|nr:NAD(P)-dependent alcohol dehydrogenase [Streptomyces sp. TRM 70351]MEE1928884.1 NAD(P)-dependent alcohol dehydrogenase [Streptomyces sp. TRM 70351]
MLITAAVVYRPGGPFELAQVEIDTPGPGEVLVRMAGSGVCHSDLIVRDQWYPVPLPVVLGHEGAGVVEAVGEGVSRVAVGDHVVLSYGFCGTCRHCVTGAPAYCADFIPRNFAGTRPDGSTTLRSAEGPVHGLFFGQSSFATYALARLASVTKVPADLPLHLLGPLGCAVQTGVGSVLHALRCGAGSSIAVFGAGSVGCSAVLGAVVAGCTTIVALGRNPARLRLAGELGATHVIDLRSTPDPVASLRDLTGGTGVDYSIEATGVPHVLRMAVDALHTRGVCGLVGAAAPGTEAALEMSGLMFGRQVRGIVEGDSVPQCTIPVLAELYRGGRLPFDRMIARYPFHRINEAAHDAATGKCVKPVLTFEEAA